VLVVAVLFGWGAWQRRWIADDGLIVLRTVRNLLAGNGPVFNMSERVEVNTSTLWTYLLYLGGVVGGPARLEYVALALSLALSLAGVVFAMLGAARLYAPNLLGRRAILLPAGVLVYIAVPPARDFATSGLENGLVLAYLGLLWWMMVYWSQQRTTGRWFTAALAFVAGLSVLVRPELALIGGLALVMMLITVRGWRPRALIVVAGGLLPVAYQIFRMGYYGLLVPGTALAKDASGNKWSQGFVYLANFNGPYLLWLPAIPLAVLGVLVLAGRSRPWWIDPPARGGYHPPPVRGYRPPPVRGYHPPPMRGYRPPPGRGDQRRVRRLVQSPPVVIAFFVGSGLLQAAYWIRQGGDFMHGRVLLTPLFCVLLPVAAVPIALPDRTTRSREAGAVLAGATATAWLAVALWALWAANSPGMGADATKVTYSGIVDERRFYSQATGNAHPVTALDYLDYPRMRAVIEAINNTPAGALLLPSGNYTQWDVVPAIPPPPPAPGVPPDPKAMQKGPHTVFFTNLGMLGMNVGLDVGVLDQIGLANPLAAHTARLEDARIGHDKNLFPDWAVADGPWLKQHPFLPPYLDEDWVTEAAAALKCPTTDAVLTSIRGPLTPKRFLSNVLHSFQFTSYRIDRVPKYELIRCGLSEPPLSGTPYTGLPAAGP
jgi:arabinofuranosyltransferase